MMKKVLVGLALAMLLAVGVAQVAMAGTPPGPGGSTNCIGFCVSQGFNGTMPVDEFARLHNPSVGGGCGMTAGNGTGYISDANPPQPQN